jgi:hypothetical protein
MLKEMNFHGIYHFDFSISFRLSVIFTVCFSSTCYINSHELYISLIVYSYCFISVNL